MSATTPRVAPGAGRADPGGRPPAVGICLDVGHAALAAGVFGFDLLEECAAAAPLVRHLHLHDNLMKTNLTGTPLVSEHPVYGLGEPAPAAR